MKTFKVVVKADGTEFVAATFAQLEQAMQCASGLRKVGTYARVK